MPFIVLLHIPKGHIKKHMGEKTSKKLKGLVLFILQNPKLFADSQSPPTPPFQSKPACMWHASHWTALGECWVRVRETQRACCSVGQVCRIFFQWKPISGGCNTQGVRLVLLGHNDRGCTLCLQSSALTGREGSKNTKMYVLQCIYNIPNMFCKPGPTWRKDGHHKTISTKLLL